jgi:predicted DNA-binding ribbon-helix-helix protein
MVSMDTHASRQRGPQVTVVLQAPLKTALTQIAQRERRSLSNLIAKLAEEYVRSEQSANAA